MPDYIPRDDPSKILWLTNFSAWLTANGAGHGFTPAEITAFSTAAGDASTAVTNNVTAQAAAKSATAAKNTALGAAIDLARADAQRLQNDPNMTDEERADAGLTIAPPLLVLDFSVRPALWHKAPASANGGLPKADAMRAASTPNPSDERENGRPSGTIGCQVQYAHGGIPAEESAWTALEIDTESPIIHTIPGTTPTTYAYRARYVGKNLKMGPFGDPAVCTVSV